MRRTDADVERVRMAFAECGIAPAVWLTGDGRIAVNWLGNTPSNPKYLSWKARAVAGCVSVCWPCRRQLDRVTGHLIPPCGHPIDPFCPEDCEVVA